MRTCNERALGGGKVGFLGVEFTGEVLVSGDAGEVVDLFYGLEGVVSAGCLERWSGDG